MPLVLGIWNLPHYAIATHAEAPYRAISLFVRPPLDPKGMAYSRVWAQVANNFAFAISREPLRGYYL